MKNPLAGRFLAITLTCILLIAALLPVAAQASSSMLLPPPPPPPPEPMAKSAPASGSITLQAQFPSTWPWGSVHWQEVWTVVQWQDSWGDWHDVEGWRGELDEVAIGSDGTVEGKKTWWVAGDDFGKGAFRWVAYQGKEGETLGVSKSFNLPGSGHEAVQIEVSLGLP
jgi:hypothetical protein